MRTYDEYLDAFRAFGAAFVPCSSGMELAALPPMTAEEYAEAAEAGEQMAREAAADRARQPYSEWSDGTLLDAGVRSSK